MDWYGRRFLSDSLRTFFKFMVRVGELQLCFLDLTFVPFRARSHLTTLIDVVGVED